MDKRFSLEDTQWMLDMGWTPSSMQESDKRGQFEAAIRRFNLGHRLTEAQPAGQEAAADLDVGAAERQLPGSPTPPGPAAPTTPAEEEVAPRGDCADVATVEAVMTHSETEKASSDSPTRTR